MTLFRLRVKNIYKHSSNSDSFYTNVTQVNVCHCAVGDLNMVPTAPSHMGEDEMTAQHTTTYNVGVHIKHCLNPFSLMFVFI